MSEILHSNHCHKIIGKSSGLQCTCGAEETHDQAEIRNLNNRLLSANSDIQNLKTVMIAAAEEIQRCWPAHCDAEGYGPANLMRRLEKGIPSQYGYTAGAFEKQDQEIKELRLQRDELKSAARDFLDSFLLDQLNALPTHIQFEGAKLEAAVNKLKTPTT